MILSAGMNSFLPDQKRYEVINFPIIYYPPDRREIHQIP